MGPQNELMPKARTAALRALQLDESLAEAHASLALIKENYDYDWPGAEKEFRLAMDDIKKIIDAEKGRLSD